MGSVLPDGWKQVCTKGHKTDHSTKCTNWICPQGRRYKDWSDVQAYFQLLYFEDDIPGVECRPENAKKIEDVAEEEDVTLEEATKKEMEEKASNAKVGKAKELKRKRPVTTANESSDSEAEAEPVEVKKKGRKKNKDEDDDYQPEADSKNNSVTTEASKKSPKKTRRSVAATKVEVKESFKCNQCKSVYLSSNDLQTHMKKAHKVKEAISTTLDETPDIPKKSDKIVPMSKKHEQQEDGKTKHSEAIEKPKKSQPVEKSKDSEPDKTTATIKKPEPVETAKKSVPDVKSGNSEPLEKTKKSESSVSEIINLDSPIKEVKNDKNKTVAKESTTPATGRSVSIVKIDDDVQEVKQVGSSQTLSNASDKEDSIKSSTQKVYDTRFEVFKEFCSKAGGGVDPMKATAATIEKFLQHMQKEKNSGKSVLSGYKSAIVKIQSDHKSQSQVEESKPAPPQPTKSKPPPLATKPNIISVSTKATITPVEQKSTPQPTTKPSQVTAAKSLTTTQSMTPPSQPKTTPAAQQQARQQTPQSKPQVGQQNQKRTSLSRDSTPQGGSVAVTAQKTPQSQTQQKQTTPQSQPRAGGQQNQVRQQTPQSNPRQQTPQSNPRQQTPQSNPRQQAPQASARTPQTNPRQTTPQPGARQQTPQSNVTNQPAAQPQVRQQSQSGTPRAQAPRAQTLQIGTPRQQGPQVRGIQPSTQTRQGTPHPRQQVPQTRQQTPQPRQQRPQQSQNTQTRQQQTNQVRQQLVKNAAATPPPQSKLPQFTELPSFLKSLVNFPCKLETNAGGGPSLYRASAQHTGLGQEGWQELRKYCQAKLLEWWQWYEPYYTFPLQVKVRMRNQTVQKTIPSSAEFQKFLKSDESLYSFHMSECELYCLANILGVPIYQLTYNLVGVGGKPEERCRWDTLDPHHGLIHQNKFNSNKEPLYILYEDKIHFCKIVQTK